MKFRIIHKLEFQAEYFLPIQKCWLLIFDNDLNDITSPTYKDILFEIKNFSKSFNVDVEIDKNSLRELKIKRIINENEEN